MYNCTIECFLFTEQNIDISFNNEPTFFYLVKLTIWLSDKHDFSGFNQAYQQYMGEHRPSRSTVCAELMLPNALIEIEAIAAY